MPTSEPASTKAGSPDPPSNPFATGRSLILLQLLSRLLTFALNQSLVRLAPPEVFGTAAIQFDLICATILFLSREGIRNALLRGDQKNGKGGDGAIDTNRSSENGSEHASTGQQDALARLPLLAGAPLSALLSGIYLYSSGRFTTSQPSFHISLGLYITAALLELLIEPLYVRALRSIPPKLNVRVQAEGGMAIVKAVVTFGCMLVWPERALFAFGLGQALGATWLAGRYVREYGLGPLWGRREAGKDSNRSNPAIYNLAMANTRQSVIKHLLTEADRIAVGRISPLSDQGGYAVAMNYGSLIARILFQPVEETLLLHFSTSLSSPLTIPRFTYILHLSSHLLLLLPCFVPPLLPAIIPLLLPRRYLSTSAPSTLETYLTWYIPLLSLNGILEAFHASSATPEQVKRQARFMVASSAGFAATLWAMTHLDVAKSRFTTEQSLILASCAGMILRIVYAYLHARSFAGSRGQNLQIKDVLPHPAIVLSSVTSGAVLRMIAKTSKWQASWRGWFELVGLGGVLGLTILGSTYLKDRPRLRALKQSQAGKDR